MSAAPRPHSVSPSTRGAALPLAGTVSVWPASTSRCGRPRSVRATRLSPTRSTLEPRHRGQQPRRGGRRSPASSWLTDGMSTSSAVRREQVGHAAAQTVDAVVAEDVVERAPCRGARPRSRRLMTSTQGRPNSPPGNARGRVAGTATRPGGHDAPAELLAGLGVDDRDRRGEDRRRRRAPCPSRPGRPRRPCSGCRCSTRRRRSPARPAAARARRRCRRRRRGARWRRSGRTSRPWPRCRPSCSAPTWAPMFT